MGNSGAMHLLGRVYGEVKAEDIPLPGDAEARMQALLAGDDDPLPVVVGVGVGKGGRGWRYMPEYLKGFVDQVNNRGMVGILGHQRDEDVGHQFPDPVTHWLAAKWDPEAAVVDVDGKPTGDKGVAYFRGVVDKRAADLKRWLRGRMVTQPSIYGMPVLEQQGGETVVRQGRPLSIDWAPLGRAGMPTAQLLALGEMDAIGAPQIVGNNNGRSRTVGQTFRELAGELRDLGVTPQQVIQELGWRADQIVPALAAIDRRGLAEALGKDVLVLVPAGEIAGARALPDLLPAYNPQLATVAELVDKPAWQHHQAAVTALGELASLFGLQGAQAQDTAQVVAHAKAAQEAVGTARKAAFKATVERVVAAGEMGYPPAVRPLVTDLLVAQLAQDASEEAIKQAAGEMKQRDSIKPLLGVQYSQPAPHGGSNTNGHSSNGNTNGLQTFDGALEYERRRVI